VSGSCLVVMYHYVRDTETTPFPAIRALSPADFARQLDWLQAGYRLVSAADVEAAVEGHAALPPRAALLTFDDGFVDHHSVVLPILQTRGLTGLFFVAGDCVAPVPRLLGVHKTHFLLAALGADAFGRAVLERCASVPSIEAAARAKVFGRDRWEHADERAIKNLLNYELTFAQSDRVLSDLFLQRLGDETAFARALYLSEVQVSAMAASGMTFGYHTRSHRMLSRLDRVAQDAELRDGVSRVRALTGQERVSFCYPWGGVGTYTPETVAILKESGYSVAFNTVRRRAHIGVDVRFELPRVDTRDLPPFAAGEPPVVAESQAAD